MDVRTAVEQGLREIEVAVRGGHEERRGAQDRVQPIGVRSGLPRAADLGRISRLHRRPHIRYRLFPDVAQRAQLLEFGGGELDGRGVLPGCRLLQVRLGQGEQAVAKLGLLRGEIDGLLGIGRLVVQLRVLLPLPAEEAAGGGRLTR